MLRCFVFNRAQKILSVKGAQAFWKMSILCYDVCVLFRLSRVDICFDKCARSKKNAWASLSAGTETAFLSVRRNILRRFVSDYAVLERCGGT